MYEVQLSKEQNKQQWLQWMLLHTHSVDNWLYLFVTEYEITFTFILTMSLAHRLWFI